ncbi:MAG: hypothetical protein ACRCS9_02475 [Hyphomicrobium sp.]
MDSLITSGRIADVILAMMVLEGLFLTFLFRGASGAMRPLLIWTNLMAGAALVLALKSVLQNDDWTWTALWLALALVAHAADLAARWRA